MKKIFVFALCSSLMLGSCGTYTGSGAYAGATLGPVLGSAIGGLSGGPRGADMGAIIGMVGGATVGAVLGSQADQAQAQRQSSYQGRSSRYPRYSDDSYQGSSVGNDSQIFDSTNGGDDRIYDLDMNSSSSSSSTGSYLTSSPSLEILHARFVDSNGDNSLSRNETCKMVFEVRNAGKQAVYDIVPTVVETTGNKHIFISPSVHVEKIDPGNVIRYTAMIKADNRLKEGCARFCVSVIQGGKAISKVNQFDIPTKR